jgi:hypothetical protein
MGHEKEHGRICEAYQKMAGEALYRPAASGPLSAEELADPDRLAKEASEYASHFINQEDKLYFRIGVSNFRTNRALVYTIEASRLLCSGTEDKRALKLLEMAIADING